LGRRKSKSRVRRHPGTTSREKKGGTWGTGAFGLKKIAVSFLWGEVYNSLFRRGPIVLLSGTRTRRGPNSATGTTVRIANRRDTEGGFLGISVEDRQGLTRGQLGPRRQGRNGPRSPGPRTPACPRGPNMVCGRARRRWDYLRLGSPQAIRRMLMPTQQRNQSCQGLMIAVRSAFRKRFAY